MADPSERVGPSVEKAADALSLAARVARRADLLSVWVESAAFDVRDVKAEDAGLAVQCAQEFERTGDQLQVRVRCGLTAQAQVGKRPNQVIHIKADFVLRYLLGGAEESSLPEEAIDRFARINGVYNAWPYWREFVQNCTMRTELPPLTLPVLNISGAVALAGFAPEQGAGPTGTSESRKTVGSQSE